MAFYRRRPIGRYGRKRFGLRRKRAGGSWMRYGAKAGSLAYRAYQGYKYLRSLINVEHQKFDTSVTSATAISTTPQVTHVSAIAVGDAEGNRTGNSVLAKYLYLKCSFALNTSANYTRMRMAIVQDSQQVGDTAPSYLDVYKSVDPQALINGNTVGRFNILKDFTINLTVDKPQILFDKYIRLGSHIRFNGNNGTDIQKNGLYVMLVSDQATNTPTCTVQARLMYIDN